MDTFLAILFAITVKLLEVCLPVVFLLSVAVFAVKVLGNVFKPIYLMFEIFFHILYYSFCFIKSVFQHGALETFKHLGYEKKKGKNYR